MATVDDDPAPTNNENTPLLKKEEPEPVSPLNKKQIALLTATRVVEPLGFSILFPFINSMVQDVGKVATEDVGFYVGWIESLYSLTSLVLFIPCGLAADRIGRRPVLLWTLAGSAIFTAAFGFSTSIWQMIIFRSLAGMFSGSSVVIRTLFSENSDSTNSARAFSFYALASNLGLFLGPIMGGLFADPTNGFLSRLPLIKAHPYYLPGVISGVMILIADLLCFFYLNEPKHREAPERGLSALRQLVSYNMLVVFLSIFWTALLGVTYTALIPLFLYTPVELGGLAFTPSMIGAQVAAAGLCQAFWLLVVMPPLDKKIGTRALLRACYFAWPLSFTFGIFQNLAARHHHDSVKWTLIGFSTAFASGVAMAFTSVVLLLNKFAPPGTLATANGASLSLMALTRTLGPAATTSIFAYGVKHDTPYLAWYVLIAIGVAAAATSFLIPRDPKEKVEVA